MQILENRRAACVIVFLMMFFSVWGIGGNGLKKDWLAARDMFKSGGEDSATSISGQINTAGEIGSNLVVIAEKYLDDADLSGLLNSIDNLNETEEDDIRNKERIFKSLTEAAYGVIEKMKSDAGTVERDAAYIFAIEADMDACLRKIRYDSYNEYAKEVNANMEGLYTGTVAKLRGLYELPVFSAL